MLGITTPQTIDLQFAGRRHFFHVYRFTTDAELLSAIQADKITDKNAYKKGVIAYTDCYPEGDECGRMYLLSKTVDTYAHEATHMAVGILSRCGHSTLAITTDEAPENEEMLCQLVGAITSELYSRNKAF